MPELKFTIQCEADGASLPDFPLIFRLVVAQYTTQVNTKAADNNSTTFTHLGPATMNPLQALLLQTNEALNVIVAEADTEAFISLNAGGCMILIGSNVTTGSPNNVRINNPAATGQPDANLVVVVAGT